jgi:hypothetical protein
MLARCVDGYQADRLMAPTENLVTCINRRQSAGGVGREMPRTITDIAYTDRRATEIGYVAPPSDIEPTGKIFEDLKWTALVDWFDGHIAQAHGWHDAVLVYVSRRYDTPIADAYAATDNWAKGQFQRLEIREDPDAAYSYGN